MRSGRSSSQALQKEKDDASAARRADIERELAELRAKSRQCDDGRVAAQKDSIDPRPSQLRQRLAEARGEAERAERDADLQRAAELRYGEIPELERQVAEVEAVDQPSAGATRFFKQEVDAEDVARSSASGPASVSPARGRGQLIHMEETPAPARRGPGRSGGQPSPTHLRRSRAGLQDPNRPIGVPSSAPPGVGRDQLARTSAEFIFDSQDAMVHIDHVRVHGKHAVSRPAAGRASPVTSAQRGGRPAHRAVRRRPYHRRPAR